MRVSTWIAFPFCIVVSSALAIPTSNTPDDAIAGSIAPNSTEQAEQTLNALEYEYQKLESLKHQLSELHHEVLRQEHQIFTIINQDFRSCSGVKCYLQTALRKAPDFFELFKTHFRHAPKNGTSGFWECPWSNDQTQDDKELASTIDVLVPVSTPVPSLPSDVPFQFDGEHFPPPPPPMDDLPFPFDSPPPPPPPPPPMPEYDPFKPNPAHPAGHPHDHPHDHKPPRPFRMPHPAPRHRHFRLIVATAGGVVSALILIILFKALRVYLANPRVQADRAARIEECRTRREYRRAACQHRVRQCLSRLRGRRRRDSSSGDYEEKRAMIQRASSVDAADHILGADINSLRRAHELVGRLMLAEEGRLHTQPATNTSTQPDQDSSSQAGSSRSARSLNTMTTLPPYAPPPPRYSQELSRDMEVVDGFSYTPTPSEATVTSSASSFILDDADLCTESSVVDCTSRLSMDTESVAPSQSGDLANGRNRKSLELASDRFRGQFD